MFSLFLLVGGDEVVGWVCDFGSWGLWLWELVVVAVVIVVVAAGCFFFFLVWWWWLAVGVAMVVGLPF